MTKKKVGRVEESEKMSGVIIRFRVMAVVAGVMSLLLWFVEMPVKYLLHNDNLHESTSWIPIAHGYIYPFYVLSAIHFAVRAQWKVSRMIFLILAGTLPVASFIAERRVHREYSNS